MKKTLLLSFLFLSQVAFLNAQIPDGSIAPNFIAKDINGVEYNLYDILDSGRDVVLDFSTTWCGPCWSYKNTGTMHDFYDLAGPDGSNTAMNFFVECDPKTTMDDLMGNTGASQGDWVTGTTYPIIDNASIAAAYQIGAYPTILMVCKDRRVTNVQRASATELVSQTNTCPSIDTAPEPLFFADNYDGCGTMDVQFTDDSWPRPTSYLWNFGDGNTSTERNPKHTYTESGDFSVSLSVTNDFGTTDIQKSDLIAVGDGNPNSIMAVGITDKEVGSGRIFEGGSHALIFDAINPFVLSSVKVYAQGDGMRKVVLLNSAGQIVNSKEFDIPDGESRINLDFFVDEGTEYRLGMHSEAYLFRNNGGVVYPYTLDNLVSITGSTAGSDGYYYYFYDWAVREAGCDGFVDTDDILESPISVFPNPASDVLTLEGDFSGKEEIIITNAVGQAIWKERNFSTTANSSIQIDISSFSKGVHLVKVGSSVYKFVKE